MTLSDLAKHSIIQIVARPVCDSCASCSALQLQEIRHSLPIEACRRFALQEGRVYNSMSGGRYSEENKNLSRQPRPVSRLVP